MYNGGVDECGGLSPREAADFRRADLLEGNSMQEPVYISGHRNPDTDSICAAIGYAHLKRKLGVPAVPVRLGEINNETKFVLEYFDVPPPIFLETVKRQVSDLNMDAITPVSPHISVKTAWNIMRKNNVKVLPVVDDNEKIMGIVTLSDITNKYMDAIDNNTLSASGTTIGNILDTINAKLLVEPKNTFRTTGHVHVAASGLEEIRAMLEAGDILITGMRPDILEQAIESRASLIIVTCRSDVPESITEKAAAAGVVVMSSISDSFTVARLINQSIPISYVMSHDNLVIFEENDLVDDIREKMLKTRYRSYPVVDSNLHVKGFISRYHLISPKQKKIILVDHNEKGQTVNGIEQAELLEIIDHHRLGDLQTGTPIFFKNEPVGSTSTIIANMYFESGIRPTVSIAGILCAAIVSDTLKFVSPTATYTDRIAAERLAEIAGIRIDVFSTEMFKAGTSLKGRAVSDIVKGDLKDFRLGKLKIGIGQIYSQDAETLEELRPEIMEMMDSVVSRDGFNILMLLVTDIVGKSSEAVLAGPDKELVPQAFGVAMQGSSIRLEGVVSRKKQVVPRLAAIVE